MGNFPDRQVIAQNYTTNECVVQYFYVHLSDEIIDAVPIHEFAKQVQTPTLTQITRYDTESSLDVEHIGLTVRIRYHWATQ